MPLYDYQCKQCQKVTEVRHGFTEVYAEPCPQCGGPVARVFNPAGIVFKGSGFYITDSRKGGASGEGPATASSGTTPAAAGGTSTPAPAAAPTTATPAKKSDAA